MAAMHAPRRLGLVLLACLACTPTGKRDEPEQPKLLVEVDPVRDPTSPPAPLLLRVRPDTFELEVEDGQWLEILDTVERSGSGIEAKDGHRLEILDTVERSEPGIGLYAALLDALRITIAQLDANPPDRASPKPEPLRMAVEIPPTTTITEFLRLVTTAHEAGVGALDIVVETRVGRGRIDVGLIRGGDYGCVRATALLTSDSTLVLTRWLPRPFAGRPPGAPLEYAPPPPDDAVSCRRVPRASGRFDVDGMLALPRHPDQCETLEIEAELDVSWPELVAVLAELRRYEQPVLLVVGTEVGARGCSG